MNRKLSSSFTMIYKYLFPFFWVVGFGLATLTLWFSRIIPPETQNPKGQFLIIWIAGTSFLLWSSRRLKTVTLSHDHLLIRNYSKTIKLPLSSVKDITESWFNRPNIVKLHIYPSCDFGNTIVFIPKFRMWGNPLVPELKELIMSNSDGHNI